MRMRLSAGSRKRVKRAAASLRLQAGRDAKSCILDKSRFFCIMVSIMPSRATIQFPLGDRLLQSPARPAMARPRTLFDAAMRARGGNSDAHLREFLDQFYVTPDPVARAAMIEEEPPSLGSARADAYFAAVAEHLALCNRLPVPGWTSAPGRFLHRPFFPGGLESLKATTLKESPAAFRRRLIFVDADPLYRPRRDTAGTEIGA
jgi:hypothetical protein